MADKPDIQYISRFFVPGSDAPQVAPKYERKKTATQLPEALPRKQIRIFVDPVALCSVVVAAAILILMVVSVVQFTNACEEYQTMSNYLTALRDQNVTLAHKYNTGLDLEAVEAQALALGMVPMDQAKTVKIQVTIPVPEPEPTLWDEIVWFLDGLLE